jgi:hypothetical protein
VLLDVAETTRPAIWRFQPAGSITVKTSWAIAHPHFKGRGRLSGDFRRRSRLLAVCLLVDSGHRGAVVGRHCLRAPATGSRMNVCLLYWLLLKGTITAFAGLASRRSAYPHKDQ